MAHVRRLAERLGAFQIDSVNVVARAHYVPAFARLGPYPTDVLDSLAYRRRELFEYWGHAACLLPISRFPLVRYRMDTQSTLEMMSTEDGAGVAAVYAEVAERGPLAASDLANPGKRSGKWWGWGDGKLRLEFLFDSGLLAIAGRRNFERLYDLVERVIPREALDAPAPPREEAMKELICAGARACGVGAAGDITGYFHVDGWRDRLVPGPRWARQSGEDGRRRAKPISTRLVAELVEEGRLVGARVEGWSEPGYLAPEARIPRTVEARALVTPFDSLVWDRRRIERLFGMRYTIEIYVPAHKRVYGYYVFPFLLGDTLVARCDLKADRQRSALIVHGAFSEPGHDARTLAADLADELHLMRSWLGLDHLEIGQRGDLARHLRQRAPNSTDRSLGGDRRSPSRVDGQRSGWWAERNTTLGR